MNENGFNFEHQEEDMTREFICGLFKLETQYNHDEGIHPYVVYSKQFSQIKKTEAEKKKIIKKLVENNLKRSDDDNKPYLEYVGEDKKIRITEYGRTYCQTDCRGTGDPKID